ncbi:uncharacterized protein LOC135825765 [Sycon ciliatum]|uniref:uncharacterized protein LOC135825765 n=1 Tax=Sycon ciliatum TaxID=27933 RepID=UPI0031F69252
MSVAGVDVHHHVSVDQLKPGDHVYYHTVGYAFTHHGIYDGNGFIIHRPCGVVMASSGQVHVPTPNPMESVLTSLRIRGSAGGSSSRQVASEASPTTTSRSTGDETLRNDEPNASSGPPGSETTSTSSGDVDDPPSDHEPASNDEDQLPSGEDDGEHNEGEAIVAVEGDEDDGTVHVPAEGGVGCVKCVKIEDFAGPHDLRLFRYERSKARSSVAPTGTCSEYPRNAHRTSVALARWFLRHPTVFNEYDKLSWHCEHFATFCCSTWLGVADMDEALEAGNLKRSFLLESSNAFGSQTESKLAALRAASRVLISPIMLALDTVGAKVIASKVQEDDA